MKIRILSSIILLTVFGCNATKPFEENIEIVTSSNKKMNKAVYISSGNTEEVVTYQKTNPPLSIQEVPPEELNVIPQNIITREFTKVFSVKTPENETGTVLYIRLPNNSISHTPTIEAKNEATVKPFWDDARTWIAFIAIIVSLINFGWNIFSWFKSNKHSIIDEYWLRKVILPKINDDIDLLYTDGMHAVAASSSSQLDSRADDVYLLMMEQIDIVRSSFDMLAPISKAAVTGANNVIDMFEDTLEDNKASYNSNPKAICVDLRNKIISYLINEFHLKSR
jgi:hypothetical protein